MQIGGSLGQGLLRPIQTVEGCKAHPQGPEPSAARLGPRGFSAGVVDSLAEGFVLREALTKPGELNYQTLHLRAKMCYTITL